MKRFQMIGWIGTLALTVSLMAGCAMLDGGRSSRIERTSLVKFLYPNDSSAKQAPEIPTLHLPLRIGVAWVPPGNAEKSRADLDAVPEQQLQQILEKVKEEFRSLPFVKEIQVIPTAYLQPEGGFENLDQLRTIFDIDVIALVSRDQKQFTGQTELSFLYWTIVGAYLVPAERNETYTMVDTAVFDIESRKLLFRAPGTSRLREYASLVTAEEEFRTERLAGLQQASTNMTTNLKTELSGFQKRLKDKPETAHIVFRSGYTGGSAGGWVDLALVGAVASIALTTLRRKA
jgi:rhombotail lipoprotein